MCPNFMQAFQSNAAKLEVMLMAFYSLLQVFVLCDLKWRQCNYSKALKSRACVKGSALCICFVPCVSWWQQFVKHTGKVTSATPACHLVKMTPTPPQTHTHTYNALMTNVQLPSFNIDFNYGPITAACPSCPAAICNNKTPQSLRQQPWILHHISVIYFMTYIRWRIFTITACL